MFLLGCLKVPNAKRVTLMSFTPQLAINLTKSLCSFIDVYAIRWWETYETCCLPAIFTKMVAYNASRDIQVSLNIIETYFIIEVNKSCNYKTIFKQVTCACLKGLKFCIQQFIHPDQALLLTGTPNSTLNEMATELHQCTVSIFWEVRDSAMEVVLEMAQLSHVSKYIMLLCSEDCIIVINYCPGYPEFQNLLIHSHLLEAALSAFNDTEAYVRASAIAVVAAATPVPQLWEHLTNHSDVISSCYSVLQQDSEALARRAAAKALTLIIQSGHFP